jgi:hypothetical protein
MRRKGYVLVVKVLQNPKVRADSRGATSALSKAAELNQVDCHTKSLFSSPPLPITSDEFECKK